MTGGSRPNRRFRWGWSTALDKPWGGKTGRMILDRKCSIEGCGNPHFVNGLCDAHRQRAREGIDMDTPLVEFIRLHGALCTVATCDRKATVKGMCGLHFKRLARGADLLAPPNPRKRKPRGEGIDGCDRCASIGYLCDSHHTVLLRYRLTRDRYLELMSAGCAICGVMKDSNGAPLVIDHDHACCPGKRSCGACVRSALCTRHNIMAGFLDKPDTAAVMEYILKGKVT